MMWWLDAYDLIAGLFVGIYLTQNYYKSVLPPKVTVLPAEGTKPYVKWSELLAPHASRLKLAGTFGMAYTFNSAGALAMSKLLDEVGETLDCAVQQNLIRKKEMS
jgi:hypothetical protein